MSWVVAIPSYSRPKELKKKTLAMLKKGQVPASKIFVFVVKEQLKEYEETLDKDTYNKIVVGKKGLANQRQFINDYFSKGQKIMSFDDDIRAMTELKDMAFKVVSNVSSLITECFSEVAKLKGNLFGFNPTGNGYYAHGRKPITTNLGYVIGAVYGYTNTKDPKVELKLGDAMEDKERTLRYFLRDGIVVKFNRYSFKTQYFAPGGMDSPTRRKEHEEGAKKLESLFPEYVKAYLKPPAKIHPNGLWDIRFTRNAKPPEGVAQGGNFATFHGGNSAPHTYNEISEEELNNSEISRLPLRNLTNYHKTRSVLMEALNNITIPKIAQGLHNRGLVIGNIGRTLTFGFGDNRHGWNFYKSNERHDEVYKALINFGNQVVPKGWKYQGITLNYGVKAKKHIDSKNVGRSVIIGIGDYTGGDIRVWDKDNKNPKDYNIHEKPTMFNGGILAHETQPFKGERYTIIFFKQKTRPKNKEIGIGKGQTGKVAKRAQGATPAPIFA